MSDNDSIRLVLEQEGPYAFRIEFDGTSLEALHTDQGLLALPDHAGRLAPWPRRAGRRRRWPG